jgi:hypothetical protein
VPDVRKMSKMPIQKTLQTGYADTQNQVVVPNPQKKYG